MVEISIGYLLTGGVTILVTLYYLWIKKNSAEAINENVDVKNKINELNKDLSKNQGLLEAEDEKRKQLERKAKEKKNEDNTVNNVIDFFRKR